MKINRRNFLAAALAAPLAAQSSRPPNIVFILADDLGWADTTPYGADLHDTPNLARLAAEGVRFTQAYAAAPVCSPTRASVMTGKFPARLHMTIWHESARNPPKNRAVVPPVAEENLPLAEVTLAEVLKGRGYATGHIGKWHLGTAGFYPEAQGFDVNIGGTFWGAPQTFFHPYSGSKHFGGETRYVPGLGVGKPGDYLTDRLTDEALKFIDSAAGRPYFLNLWYHTVHTPIEGKPEQVKHYQGKLDPKLNHRNAEYAAMVRSLDENVGRVLQKVDASNTIVIFASDNGGYIGDYNGQRVTSNHPLRSGKGSLYEGGIRIPLIFRGPGIAKGGVSDQPVITTDLFATVSELSGAQAQAQDGLSLVPLLKNPKAALQRERLFFHYPHYYPTTTPVSAIREGRWKLLEYLEDGKLELFDLVDDPSEQTNLAARHADRASALRGRLDSWRRSVNAQMPSRP